MSICNEKLPFIFISYSHRDTSAVIPIINRLRAEGYNVWYDDGIEPGSEWDDNIANHIMNCSYFISFISKNYLGSDNCKDELKYCRDLNKEQLLVYLEEVSLPGGMAMRMNRIQAIMWNRFHPNNIESAYQKLFSAVGIEKTRVFPRAISQPVVQPMQQGVPVQHGAPMQQPVPVQHGAPMQQPMPVQHGAPMQQTVPVQHGAPMQQPMPVQHGAPMQQPVPVQHGAPMQQPVPVQHGSPMPQKAPVPTMQQGALTTQNAPAQQKQQAVSMQQKPSGTQAKPVKTEKKNQNSVIKIVLLVVAGILLLLLFSIIIIGGILLLGSSSTSNNNNSQNNSGDEVILNSGDYYMMTIDELEERALDGDAEAMYFLGDSYYYGENGVEVSIEDALFWYESSAECGYLYGMEDTAYMYFLEEDYRDFSKTVYWAELALEQEPDNCYMLYLIGSCYYYGDSSLDVDYELAFSYYLQAAELGDEDAMYMVAMCYDYGFGVEQDSEEAEKWYQASEEAYDSN